MVVRVLSHLHERKGDIKMSKELEYLYDIWGETYTDWERDPVTMDIYYEDDERFLTIEKALKRNEPMKPEPIKEQLGQKCISLP